MFMHVDRIRVKSSSPQFKTTISILVVEALSTPLCESERDTSRLCQLSSKCCSDVVVSIPYSFVASPGGLEITQTIHILGNLPLSRVIFLRSGSRDPSGIFRIPLWR